MTEKLTSYEVYALRQGMVPGRNASDWYYRYGVYGTDDVPLIMECYFWLLRDGHRTILVDCGFAEAHGSARGVVQTQKPVDLLARMGIVPKDVDHVVLSHLHYDHIGNTGLFPNATFSVAQAELDFWTGPHGAHPAVSSPVERCELRAVLDLQRQERLQLIGDSETLFPGVEVTRLGGHTPGQLITEVATSSGQVVLASDAIHFYDEMRLDRLYNGYTEVQDMLAGYATLRALEARPDTWVVAGHDPEVARTFATAEDDCFDLTQRTPRT